MHLKRRRHTIITYFQQNGFRAGQTDEERVGQRGGPGFTRRAANLPTHQRRVQRCEHCAQLQPDVDAVHEDCAVVRNARAHA